VPNSHIIKSVEDFVKKTLKPKILDVAYSEEDRVELKKKTWNTIINVIYSIRDERLSFGAGYALTRILESLATD
jgi:hypothetical protein